MPNADSSEMTRLKRLKAQANDSNGNVALSKFRKPSPDGILPVQIKYSLSKFLPGMTSVHSTAAAQRLSAGRPIGFPPVDNSPIFIVWGSIPATEFASMGGADVLYANGYWVAVGIDYNLHAAVWSTDGVNWTPNSFVAPHQIYSGGAVKVKYGSGKWVVVGYDGTGNPTIWYTTNPSGAWYTSGDNVFNDGGGPSAPKDIATDGNGKWVVVGDNSTYQPNQSVFSSSDFVTWTVATNQSVQNVYTSGYGNAVAYGNGKWVTVGFGGDNNDLYWSSDGMDWTNVPGMFNGGMGNSVATDGNGNWVAVGSGGNNLCWSTDGINWTIVPGMFTGGMGNSVATDGNGNWVAVGLGGNNDNLYISRNLTTWTAVTGVFNGGYGSAVSYGNGYWVATGTGTTASTYSSKNLLDWTPIFGTFTTGRGAAVAYGNGYWVVVGTQSGGGDNLYYSKAPTH